MSFLLKRWQRVLTGMLVHSFRIGCLSAVTALAITPTLAADIDAPARTAAEWAVETGRADALADSIRLLLETGHSLDADNPFSVADLIEALESLPGGRDLATDIRATAARGQIGGASRRDVDLAPGEVLRIAMLMAPEEYALVEARLFRGGGDADLDIRVFDETGQLLASDIGTETGIEGFGAYAEFWSPTCLAVIIEAENTGTAPGRVALLAPQSGRRSC